MAGGCIPENRQSVLSYKDILRYVLDSEECKIDSAKVRDLRTLAEHLCTTVNDEFMKYYLMVENDVSQIKKGRICSRRCINTALKPWLAT